MNPYLFFLLVFLIHSLCFLSFVVEKNYAAAGWVLIAAIWAAAWLSKVA